MRKLTYYIAATLDGYIADPNGQVDGFLPFDGDYARIVLDEYPETLPVHVRGPMGIAEAPNTRFDTVVMGRGTYDPGLSAGITSPYAHLRQYVVSRTLFDVDPDVTFVADDPAVLVRDLKQQEGLGIWLAGGGKLAAAVCDEIDELIIKRHPIVLGAGIPMFDGRCSPAGFVPTAAETLDTGLVVAAYARA